VEGTIFKQRFITVLIKCLDPIEAQEALVETYESICVQHLGAKALAMKILQACFFWPTMLKDRAKAHRPIYIGSIQIDPNPPFVQLTRNTPHSREGGARSNIDPFKPNNNGPLYDSRESLPRRLRFPRNRNRRALCVPGNNLCKHSHYIKGTLSSPQR
jgi:hypothetical protein